MKIRFGQFTHDLDTRQLTNEGREIHVSPKAFELLTTLVVERPKVLSKAVLQERLWPGTFVAEANLSNLIAEIREALGDRARAPLFIRTAHGFGYAFCGNATTLPDAIAPESERPSCWLEWDRRRFPLSVGEHVIGRDPDVEVRLDASTVFRRHARLVVTARVGHDHVHRSGSVGRGFERQGPVSGIESCVHSGAADRHGCARFESSTGDLYRRVANG